MKNSVKFASKASRLAFMRLAYGAGVFATVATAQEVREEISLVTARQDLGKLEIDSDLPELPSTLSFRDVNEFGTGQHDEATLTPCQRKQLAREVAEYRAAQSKKFAIVPAGFWSSINLINPRQA